MALLTAPVRYLFFSTPYYSGCLGDVLFYIILSCEDVALEVGTLAIPIRRRQASQIGCHRAFGLCGNPCASQIAYTLSLRVLDEGGEGNGEQYIPHRGVIEQPISLAKGVVPVCEGSGKDRIQYRAEITILLDYSSKIQHVKASLQTHFHFVKKDLWTFFDGGGSCPRAAQAQEQATQQGTPT